MRKQQALVILEERMKHAI